MRAWLLLLACVRMVQGFDNGLVSASCGSMTPGHSGNAAQSIQAPYSISTDSTTYADGQVITVTLTANSGGSFKGFLLEARQVGGSSPVGSFTSAGSNAQLLSCSTPNAAVSHTSASVKTQIQSKWQAPASGNANIQFVATFVKSFSTFWVAVNSATVTYTGSSSSSSGSASSSGGSVQTASSSGTSSITSSGCGNTKTCFNQPTGCDPSTNSNCYFMSVTPSSSGTYNFEIVGGAPGYVSIAFSDDQQMGNDDVYICGKDVNGNVQIQHAFSTGTTTPTTIMLGNVSGFTSTVINGVISCSFTSGNPISTTRSSSSSSSYYIFLAYGATQNGVIQMHTTTPFITSTKVDLTTVQSLGGAEQFPPIVKAHGCLMLIAWMTTGSVGMLIARYLKKAAKGTRCCGKDFWFVAHVFLMLLTVIATCIAFIIIFSFAQDWSGGAHPVLGVIVMILSLLQPIAAMFRCGPQDERRYIFNWAHAINAVAIKGMAVAAIFTGLAMVDTSSQQWLPKVMGGFVAWEALFFLFQDFHQRRVTKNITDVDSAGTSTGILLLAIFFLGNIAFLVALLVGIGNA